MLNLLTGFSLTTKIIAAVVALAVAWGSFELWKQSLRNEGGDQRQTQIEKETKDATDNITKDADAGELSYDDCLDRGLQWNFAAGRCQS